MGLDGAAYAFVLSTGTYSLLLGLYTACRDVALTGTPKQTWPGLSVSQLFGGGWEPWAGYLRIALPSAAMIAAEWWVFETVIVMAGEGRGGAWSGRWAWGFPPLGGIVHSLAPCPGPYGPGHLL